MAPGQVGCCFRVSFDDDELWGSPLSFPFLSLPFRKHVAEHGIRETCTHDDDDDDDEEDDDW
jgi:hypothetical protein